MRWLWVKWWPDQLLWNTHLPQGEKTRRKPFFMKPASLFGKKPLVFHTPSPSPVHQTPSASSSSPWVSRKSNLKKCAYCGDAHSVKSYNTFKALDVITRAEGVQEKMLCFRCLNGAHLTSHVSVDPREPEPLTPNRFFLFRISEFRRWCH